MSVHFCLPGCGAPEMVALCCFAIDISFHIKKKQQNSGFHHVLQVQKRFMNET